MAKKGLRAWVKENWVDIANKRPDGSYPKCGRSGGEKRKRAVAQGVGGKPTNVKTFAKRAKAYGGGFMARRASYV